MYRLLAVLAFIVIAARHEAREQDVPLHTADTSAPPPCLEKGMRRRELRSDDEQSRYLDSRE
jgi:hypothetical protein